MTEKSEEIRVFGFRDVARLYGRKKKWIFRCAKVGLLLSILMVVAKGPKYTIEASFKERRESMENTDLMKVIFTGSPGSSSPEADAFMRSYTVLRPLVEKLGLQIRVPQHSFLSKLTNRFLETWKAECQNPLPDLDVFRFKDVKYEGEYPISFGIRFIDPDHFEILEGKKRLAEGRVGSEVHLDNKVVFTVTEVPEKLRLQKLYVLIVSPWIQSANLLRNSLSVVAGKTNKSIYNLSYSTRDRIQGTRILNELMLEFQNYLKREYNDLANQQMEYLSKRQHEMYCQFEGALKEYSDYMSRSLGEKGFMNLAQELQVYIDPHLRMVSQLFAIDLELQRIDEGCFLSEGSPLTHPLQTMYAKILDLQQQRDLLEISVSQSVPIFKEPFELHRELDEIRENRSQAQKLLQEMEIGSSISFDPDSMVASWAQRIQQAEIAQQERKDFNDYLSNWIRLLSVREKILSERFLHKGSIPPEFEGIDLETSRTLFVQYNSRLDQSEASMRHIANLKQQVQQENFELGSLSAVLEDPVSQKLIARATQTHFQLKDEKYRSSREEERWNEELALERSLLAEHLEQLYRVEILNIALIREKIAGLQQVGLDCINRHISVIKEQIADQVSMRRSALLQEKALLTEKMKDIRTHLASLPEKWSAENLLELKSELNQKIIQAIVELVESKTIGHHLHHIGSKPLDFAVPPILPVAPWFLIMAFLGAFTGGFGAFFISLMKAIFQGFPVDSEKLTALKMPFSGEISTFCDGPDVETISGSDLESIRRICLFADENPRASVVGLLSGRGPDFSYALAEVAGLMGRKICLLRCDFEGNFQKSDCPGLLQAIEGEDVPMRRGNGFDYLPTGGYSRFGAELIQSTKFSQLIDALKERYHLIFLYFRSPLHFAESKAALGICDKAVVSIGGERIDLLTPFTSWAYHEGYCRLTFVASDIP